MVEKLPVTNSFVVRTDLYKTVTSVPYGKLLLCADFLVNKVNININW